MQTKPTSVGCSPRRRAWFAQVYTPPRAGDANGDNCVSDADLLAVLLAFGRTGDNAADFNRDGIVNDTDLLTVLLNFGSGC